MEFVEVMMGRRRRCESGIRLIRLYSQIVRQSELLREGESCVLNCLQQRYLVTVLRPSANTLAGQ